MARLKRKQAKDASNIIRSTWPLSEVDVDVSQCWGNALVLVSLDDLHRAYQYGVEDGAEDAKGRRAYIEVLAFNTSTINAVTEEQCHA